jgi:putative addiction module killer protein
LKALIELRRFRTAAGTVPIAEWLDNMDPATSGRVQAYIDRMKSGNFGNSRSVGEGVSELKIHFGSGYRVYYLRDGLSIVVLLCGGDKGSQQADIRQAKENARDYWRRR